MQRWNALEIADMLGWTTGGSLENLVPLGPAQIDTRAIPLVEGGRDVDSGELGGFAPIFAALQGLGGHGANFWPRAVACGAGALLFGSDVDEHVLREAVTDATVPVLVADTDGWTALGELANAWRRRCGFTVVGITGSSGKTSTKDLLATLLAPLRRTHASLANLNNELGVPLTLLAAAPDTDVVICEMGMRGLHQVEYLCDIAEPDVGVLTNVGSAHLELLGSLESIAVAKAEIIAGTRRGGTAVVPAGQPGLLDLAARVPQHVRTFGSAGDESDDAAAASAAVQVIHAERAGHGITGTLRIGGQERSFSLPMHGLHNARNLAAAVAAAWAVLGEEDLGQVDLAPASLALSAGRGQRTPLADGGVLIDDAYNANPESLDAALTELSAVNPPGKRIAVLGYMAELGPGEIDLHADTGERVAAAGIDRLVAVATNGAISALAARWEELTGRQAIRVDSVEAAVASLDNWANASDAILVKASNSVGLGRCATALVERYGLNRAQPSTTAATEREDTA